MNHSEPTCIIEHTAPRLAPKRDAHACDADTFGRVQITLEGVGESTKGGDDGQKTGPVMIVY